MFRYFNLASLTLFALFAIADPTHNICRVCGLGSRVSVVQHTGYVCQSKSPYFDSSTNFRHLTLIYLYVVLEWTFKLVLHVTTGVNYATAQGCDSDDISVINNFSRL